jgi:hypothetical protein
VRFGELAPTSASAAAADLRQVLSHSLSVSVIVAVSILHRKRVMMEEKLTSLFRLAAEINKLTACASQSETYAAYAS